jgi:hypothetical protein
MSAPRIPRRPDDRGPGAEYYYRRPLGVRELLPALGVGVAGALVAFYVAKLLLERTPLEPRARSTVGRLAPARPTDLERAAPTRG